MKTFKKILSRYLCAVICIMMLVTMLPVNCFAADGDHKTVRVAYVLAPGYQEGSEGEYKTGYGYEYLQKIARINGWKYEYVYGSFSELLEKLKNGEVDLMGNLSYTEERAQSISFGTYEQGRENYYLYANHKHNVIDPLDYSTINGKKIGANVGSNQERIWIEWCSEHQINCEIVEFEKSADRQAALNNKEIDATIGGTIQQDDVTADWQVLLNFGSSPFYFGVNKARPDLLTELNSAQKDILEDNPFYNEEVHDRYMKTLSLTNTNLDGDEKKWLRENPGPIKIGYLEGFQPLSYQDANGNFKGVAADLLSEMEQQYADVNVRFEAVPYQSYDSMVSALKSGMISAVWPVYRDYWNADQNDFALTDRVMTASMMLLFKGEYTTDTIRKIGMNQSGSLSALYAKINFPDSEIIEYISYEEAIAAVSNQEVDSILYETSVYHVNEILDDTLHTFNSVTLPQSFSISFASTQENEELVSLLNKGIISFGDAGVNRSLLVNSNVQRKVTLKDYFEQNPLMANLLIGVLLAIATGIIVLIVYNKMSVRIKMAQAEKDVFEQISNSDPLTGLYNRKAVFRQCRELLNEHPGDQFVMAHIDIVNFRLFNTFFGDAAGDELLCDIAKLFRGMSNDYDYWTYGRIEADVFCAFFPYDEKKYQKHINGVLNYFKGYRSDFLVEPKLGLYFVSDPEMPVEAMFTRAALAAKEVQPGTPYSTVVYDEALENTLNEKQQIVNEMQTALEQEQFHIYLQPKYSLRNNKMVGAEALVRWIHPTKGLVSPGKFIPVFESNGFITELDRYMWEHVCQLLSKWKKEGRPLEPISVNVSRLSMYGTSTVAFLKKLVRKYEIDPKYLELELTESAYMDNPEEMKAQMIALREAGFVILLDDFGSGYSSLNTLRELPVDILKLDMKFLSMGDRDTRGELVISSIVRMAKLLKLPVVAEGVELPEQADFLKSVGCEFVQGFLFARPMPAADYEKLLTEIDEPLSQVNLPVIDHIGKIITKSESATYAMETVIPTPLACLEYTDHSFIFLRANPEFYTEFELGENIKPASQIFREHLAEPSYSNLLRAFDECVRNGKKVIAPMIWNASNGTRRKYVCCTAYEGSIGSSAAIAAVFTQVTDEVLTFAEE